jgi:hypothetical protein
MNPHAEGKRKNLFGSDTPGIRHPNGAKPCCSSIAPTK